MQEEKLTSNPYIEEILTAVDGEGQQCRAAPACTASTELETKGSLEISALTKVKFLTKNKLTQIENSNDIYESSLVLFFLMNLNLKVKLYTLLEKFPPA